MDDQTRRHPAPPLIDWLALGERLCRGPGAAEETGIRLSPTGDRETEDRLTRELRRYRRAIALTAELN